MNNKSLNRRQKHNLRPAADEQESEDQSHLSIWPPPLQFKDVGGSENESASGTSLNGPLEVNPETKAVLNSNISVQKKPEDSLNQLGAKAYTQGQNIVLPDTFSVDKKDDQKTFLHEVSHAMSNQNSTPEATTSRNGVPVNDSEQLERDADKKSEELHGKIGKSGISQIIGEKSSFVSSQDQAIQRKETKDEEFIGDRVEEINKISNQQAEFEQIKKEMTFPMDPSEEYHSDKAYEIRKGSEYGKLISYLRKDIIHIISENIKISERLAREAAMKHLSKDLGPLVDIGYDASQKIDEGNSIKSGYRTGSGGRLGNTSVTSKAEYDQADKKVKENQAILKDAGNQDPLIFIASNAGRGDLLKGLKSGASKQEKQAAITKIMALFHDFTSKTMQYAGESPFEFKPVIDQIKKGRRGPTGHDWSADPKIVNGIVGEAGFRDFISSLGPDIAALVFAIGSGFVSGGLSTFMVAASFAAEAATVGKSYNNMDLADASSKSNASEELNVLSKEIAQGKKLEFFVTASSVFLGAALDGVEIVGKNRNYLKDLYLSKTSDMKDIEITKISRKDYEKIFPDKASAEAYARTNKDHLDWRDAAKKDGYTPKEMEMVQEPLINVPTTKKLKALLHNDKERFARLLPNDIRRAGSWKALLKEVGDDDYILGGMEAWRSGVFAEMEAIAKNEFKATLVRTGSQAEWLDELFELRKGASSDMDISIPNNQVAALRKRLREHLCDKFSCQPEKLNDYLDMSIFANTPVKAAIDTIADPKLRVAMLEEQGKFETATMLNMLHQKAMQNNKPESASIIKKLMDDLGIKPEDFKQYTKLKEQHELQSVIDEAMQKVKSIELKLEENKANLVKATEGGGNTKALQAERKKLMKQLEEEHRTAMRGTTIMDASDSESFWSHTGLMEVVFKANPDFHHLAKETYPQIQKELMVVHDFAQLEAKFAKLESKGAGYGDFSKVNQKELKDLSKSSSRLANALSINSATDADKEAFAEIAKRLAANKKVLSGSVDAETIAKFKLELQGDLEEMRHVCSNQIEAMASSTVFSKQAGEAVIKDAEKQMFAKILRQRAVKMLDKVIPSLGGAVKSKSSLITRNIAKANNTKSNLSEKQETVVKAKASSAKASAQGGYTLDAVQSLFDLGMTLKQSGQEMKDFKFDLISRNFKDIYNYLKRTSSANGGLTKPDDLKRLDFQKRSIRRLMNHIYRSNLDESTKEDALESLNAILANMDSLIEPQEGGGHSTGSSKSKPKKKILDLTIDEKPAYATREDMANKEAARKEKRDLITNTSGVTKSFRVGIGKYVSIMPGEQYYVDGNNQFISKKKKR